MNDLTILNLSAGAGGLIGALATSLFKYYFDNKYKNEKMKEITENVLKLIEDEIKNNLYSIENLQERAPYTLLSVKGQEIVFSKIENLTVNSNQLTNIINMYFSFAFFNDRIVADRNKLLPAPTTKIADQKSICAENIKKYQENYLKNGSIVE